LYISIDADGTLRILFARRIVQTWYSRKAVAEGEYIIIAF
jgi:hypothetical protein